MGRDMAEAIVVVILAAIAGIIWFVRLEGRLNQVQEDAKRAMKETDRLIGKVETIDSALVAELTQIKVQLAEIKGVLAYHNKEK